MGILSRLLLFLYVLAVMVALVVGIGIYLNIIPTIIWQNELNMLLGRRETLAVLAVMILASFCLLNVVFSVKKDKNELSDNGDIELKKGERGEVKIAIVAISEVVERAALSVSGVREVNVSVHKQEGDVPIKIQLSIVLGQGYSAPEVSAETNDEVSRALREVLNVPNVPIEIKVTEVNHAAAERERRVV